MATLRVDPNNLRVGQRYYVSRNTPTDFNGTFQGIVDYDMVFTDIQGYGGVTFPLEEVQSIHVPVIRRQGVQDMLPGVLNHKISEYGGSRHKRKRRKTSKRGL